MISILLRWHIYEIYHFNHEFLYYLKSNLEFSNDLITIICYSDMLYTNVSFINYYYKNMFYIKESYFKESYIILFYRKMFFINYSYTNMFPIKESYFKESNIILLYRNKFLILILFTIKSYSVYYLLCKYNYIVNTFKLIFDNHRER